MFRRDRAHQFGRGRILVIAGFDLGQHADASQQMLVHRVVVVHVELHHRHDPTEVGHETTEHAGFVHSPQHDFGVVMRGQNVVKEPVGVGILAQLLIDQVERARGRVHGVGVEGEIVLLGRSEDADQIDRIAPECVRLGNVDAVVVDDEVFAFA